MPSPPLMCGLWFFAVYVNCTGIVTQKMFSRSLDLQRKIGFARLEK